MADPSQATAGAPAERPAPPIGTILVLAVVVLFYVGMMYVRDSKSVHWLWAIFLGMLRTSVYLILSVVFLLPGCQITDLASPPEFSRQFKISFRNIELIELRQ